MNWFEQGVLLNFLYKIINFVILAWIIVWLVRKYDVLEKVFGGYQRSIKQEIERARQMQTEAEQITREIKQASIDAERRAAETVERAKGQAKREKTVMINSAQAEAKRLLDQARQSAQSEQARQLATLQQELIERSVQHAEQLLMEQLTVQDHERLVEQFLEDLSEEYLRVS